MDIDVLCSDSGMCAGKNKRDRKRERERERETYESVE